MASISYSCIFSEVISLSWTSEFKQAQQ